MELAVAVAILGVIGTVLATVIIVVLSNNGVGGTIATNARDEQIFATYFQRDIESSAMTPNTSVTSLQCRDSRIDRLGPLHPVMELRFDNGGAVDVVDYYWQGAGSASSPARLYRRACTSEDTRQPFSDDPLVRDLNVNGGGPPVQFSVPTSCPTCLTATLAADHVYSVTAEVRTPPSTTTTDTTTTVTSTTTATTEAGGD